MIKLLKRSELKEGNYYAIWLKVRGCKKRCRTTKNELFKLGYLPVDKLTDEAKKNIEELAVTEASIRMRFYGNEGQVNFNYVEIGEHFETMELFDKRHFSLVTKLRNTDH